MLIGVCSEKPRNRSSPARRAATLHQIMVIATMVRPVHQGTEPVSAS